MLPMGVHRMLLIQARMRMLMGHRLPVRSGITVMPGVRALPDGLGGARAAVIIMVRATHDGLLRIVRWESEDYVPHSIP
ncbi:hypothetical protein AADG42_05760 [Ammonicoccus fulvus]|uniref:Secreted protein n=1 Tax=Ammonicoccus fulvus TaxID=3138240 RepID=A0ABZ3FTQ0_9ACTN